MLDDSAAHYYGSIIERKTTTKRTPSNKFRRSLIQKEIQNIRLTEAESIRGSLPNALFVTTNAL